MARSRSKRTFSKGFFFSGQSRSRVQRERERESLVATCSNGSRDDDDGESRAEIDEYPWHCVLLDLVVLCAIGWRVPRSLTAHVDSGPRGLYGLLLHGAHAHLHGSAMCCLLTGCIAFELALHSCWMDVFWVPSFSPFFAPL